MSVPAGFAQKTIPVSDATESAETSIDRHDNSSNESRRITAQPEKRPGEIIGFAKATHPSRLDDAFAPRRHFTRVGIDQQKRFCSPMKKLGAIAFTRMFTLCSRAMYTASHCVKLLIAAFAAL
jgi:hypothetical protein